MLEKKLINIVNNLRKVKNNLTKDELKIIYDALIVPLMSYHVTSWGSSYEPTLKHLEDLQIQALDIVFNFRQCAKIEKFISSGCLPIKGLYLLKMAAIKQNSSKDPADNKQVSTWQNNHGKKCQTCIGHHFHNSLPNDVKICDNFEEKCRNFILREDILKKILNEKILDINF